MEEREGKKKPKKEGKDEKDGEEEVKAIIYGRK